jgi:hypothetical protein
MIVPHRKHTYEPSLPFTKIALLLYMQTIFLPSSYGATIFATPLSSVVVISTVAVTRRYGRRSTCNIWTSLCVKRDTALDNYRLSRVPTDRPLCSPRLSVTWDDHLMVIP